ncbi:MAG: sulfite exporter TauE/SafE family protein [Chakrabartia sp.]
MPIWLTPAFFGTALLYASVGFGGGSTYNALLALSGVDYRVLPAIALSCNILVVVGGTWRFHQAGLVPWRRALPLALVAAPFAWAGGLTPIKESVFLGLLAASLMIAGLALLLQKEVPVAQDGEAAATRGTGLADLGVGALIGYLAGLVGIGGGIFLAPYLHVTRWAITRQVAATASLFILINSIAGLAGQMLKLGSAGLPALAGYWPLFLAVLVGGQIGSLMGIRLMPPLIVRRTTALLVLYVAGQLVWKITSA